MSLTGGKFLRHDLNNPEHQRTGGNSSVVIISTIIEIEIVINKIIIRTFPRSFAPETVLTRTNRHLQTRNDTIYTI